MKYTSSRGCVLFCENSNGKWVASLWLTQINRNPDGSVKTGWVVNGSWNFERRGSEELAKKGNTIMNRWPAVHFKEVEVINDWVECRENGEECYNQVMKRAQAIMDNDTSYEFKSKSEAEIQKLKDRIEQLNDDLDDDIPF